MDFTITFIFFMIIFFLFRVFAFRVIKIRNILRIRYALLFSVWNSLFLGVALPTFLINVYSKELAADWSYIDHSYIINGVAFDLHIIFGSILLLFPIYYIYEGIIILLLRILR